MTQEPVVLPVSDFDQTTVRIFLCDMRELRRRQGQRQAELGRRVTLVELLHDLLREPA